MDDEIIIREQAVDFHLNYTSMLNIARKLGKLRQWVYKCVNLSQTIAGNEWYRFISRTPRHIQSKTLKKIDSLIISIRKGFENRIYSQTGVLSIIYEFEHLRLKSPLLATIKQCKTEKNRIP